MKSKFFDIAYAGLRGQFVAFGDHNLQPASTVIIIDEENTEENYSKSMKKSIAHIVLLTLISMTSCAQETDLAKMSEQLFIDMNRDEIREFFTLRVPNKYFEETDNSFIIQFPWDVSTVSFRAGFDSLDICDFHMLNIEPEYGSDHDKRGDS